MTLQRRMMEIDTSIHSNGICDVVCVLDEVSTSSDFSIEEKSSNFWKVTCPNPPITRLTISLDAIQLRSVRSTVAYPFTFFHRLLVPLYFYF